MYMGTVDNMFDILDCISCNPNNKQHNKVISYDNIKNFKQTVVGTKDKITVDDKLISCRHQIVISPHSIIKGYINLNSKNKLYYNYVFNHNNNTGIFQMWNEMGKSNIDIWLSSKRLLCIPHWLKITTVLVIFTKDNYFVCEMTKEKQNVKTIINIGDNLQIMYYSYKHITNLQRLDNDMIKLVFLPSSSYEYASNSDITHVYFKHNSVCLLKKYDSHGHYKKMNIVNNKLNGIYRAWYDCYGYKRSHILQCMDKYIQAPENYLSGYLSEICVMINGQQHGMSLIYDDDDEENHYYGGVCVTSMVKYYHHGKLHGLCTDYNKWDRVMSTYHYNNGELHGWSVGDNRHDDRKLYYHGNEIPNAEYGTMFISPVFRWLRHMS